jgi:hypothetical protein
MIGEAIGRDVEFVELTPDQAREAWRDVYPAEVSEWFLEMGRHPDGSSRVSPDVERVLTSRHAKWSQPPVGQPRSPGPSAGPVVRAVRAPRCAGGFR